MPLHIYTPGVKVPSGLEPVNPIPVDSWSGPYVGSSTAAAISLANSTIPASLRFLSLEVRILAPDPGYPGQTLAYKYWYRGSTANDGLVEFSSASSTSTDVGVTLAVAGAGIRLSPTGGTGTVTFINDGVVSFNGNTGAVTGASLGANTFTALNTFNAGITTDFIYASRGSTFGGRVDVVGILNVADGVTLQATLNVTSVAKFNSNVILGDENTDTVTATGTFQGLTVSNGLLRANAGITTAFIYASTGSTFGGTLKVVGGATFDSTTDHGGVARFTAGITTSTLDVTTISKFAGGATFSSTVAVVGGLSATSLYSSTGSTFGGILNVNGGATFGGRVDVGGVLDVVSGVTLDNTLDVAGVARFTSGITTSTLNASGAIRANGGLTASTLDVQGVSRFAGGATFSSSANFAVGLTSSGNVVVADPYGYKIDNTTALASGMIHGLSASAGIITAGAWQGNLIGLTYGGTNKNLDAVGASGGVVYKDGTGLTITAAGTNGQILSNSSGTPVWVNTTSLTGITADRVRTTANNNAGTYYLTFVDGAGSSKDLFVDITTGVTYDAASGVLSCVQLEALVDGGVF